MYLCTYLKHVYLLYHISLTYGYMYCINDFIYVRICKACLYNLYATAVAYNVISGIIELDAACALALMQLKPFELPILMQVSKSAYI